MKYSFIVGSDQYTLENYWFGEASLILFCNGNEIYRVKSDSKHFNTKCEFTIRASNQTLKILATPNIFSVDIKVVDEKENILPLERSKLSIRDFFQRFSLSFDLPSKSLWNRGLFIVEVCTVILAIWLLCKGSYIDGLILMILATVGLLKANIK